ncbi:DUF3696 domain-containing protein [Kordiimonas sp. SCSIO 12603]|uniref:AAA family ATPase n=1 Tax=Kordiimonas sp. SCSIO 12603 TaxID=2829596 RepID=UPI0021042374|nr:DUF3696 domain-containing protein [Kordiimonas sp. SCSIO 12603]UTW59295.1 DUF3696 domain-containing protein [Kordiimonas sp. SCSIO 12603]
MLTNLNLKNIKCFSELDITLSKVNVLTGINGAGKSSLIQSILMVSQSATKASIQLNGSLVEIGDYGDLLHEKAEDDYSHISFAVDGKNVTWGYNKDNVIPSTEAPIELPILDGEIEHTSVFDNLLYISAERWGPRNNVPFNIENKNKTWLGKHGEYTIPLLGALDTGELPGKNLLDSNDPRHHENGTNDLITENIYSWMGEISPNVRVNAQVIKKAATAYSTFSFGDSQKQHKASNVGFGLSYALSVVTALLIAEPGNIVIIENPEAHLHPRGQSKLGQLIGLTAEAGVQVIIETHSEHVINGARILVRKKILSAPDLNILYFQRNDSEKKSSCQKLDVNDVGQLSSWPEGFFDQQAIDMRTLISGK